MAGTTKKSTHAITRTTGSLLPLKKLLAARLPSYGHRNWIVVADSAYPQQSRAGIETFVTGADHLDVIREVLAAIGRTSHVQPTVKTDHELSFVSDVDAPGVSDYRNELTAILGNRAVDVSPHEQIIHDLDHAALTFNMLILKTTLVIPYTSVFFQLECAYWNATAEQRLRQSFR